MNALMTNSERPAGSMKIVFLTSSLGAGGAERVAATLCNAWSARGDAVSLISTFSGGGQPFYELAEPVELLSLADFAPSAAKTPAGYFRRARALRRLVKQRRPDVIVSFLSNVNIAAVVTLRSLRIPLIVCERTDPSGGALSLPIRAGCRLTYRFADALAVQTGTVAAAAASRYPGLRQVVAIPNPLPPGLPAHARRMHRERKVLLSLGRLSAEKQVGKLIRVFAALAGAYADWDLHIYGDGPLKAELNAQVALAGLSGRIVLHGVTAQPWAAMAAADAFAMTSRYEGFPNAMLEAMGVGLPCIAFDCPSGPRELSGEGGDAILVPLDDERALGAALAEVMANETLRQTLGARAREGALRRFGLAAVLERWDCLFDRLGALPRQAAPGQVDMAAG
jgi:GalNAc-alpha-(1->4)-GalNAc-alpha-(1->3)-diNAcBac-PP-undecaprenol alpha-1,4-N-acetyl-D-galactosaminyltransferase